ncbi:MAG: CDP-archaeol synthase [Promethearchaeota archaeon]
MKNAKIMFVIFIILLGVFILIFSLVYSIDNFVVILGLSMLFIGPTYFANAMMVFTSNGKPLDGGRNFVDGRRLFGETKTIGGFFGGWFFGFVLGLGIGLIFYFSSESIQVFTQEQFDSGINLYYITLEYLDSYLKPPLFVVFIRALFCGLGSPLGDLVGSFLKRRFGVGSGRPFWFVDQLDFIVVTILITLPWFPFDIFIVILLLILTPSITLTANTVAFMIGKKKEPW